MFRKHKGSHGEQVDQSAHEELLSDPNYRKILRRKKWIRWGWVTAGVLAVVMSVGFWFLYPELKHYQARKMVSEARELLKKDGQTDDILQKAHFAWHRAPKIADTNRLMAELYTGRAPKKSLQYWERLSERGKMTFQDRIAYANASIQANKNQRVLEQLRWLSKNHPNHSDVIAVELAWLLSEGSTSQALKKARIKAQKDEASESLRISYARLAAKYGNKKDIQEATKHLRQQLRKDQKPISLYAARFVSRNKVAFDELIDPSLNLLLSHPDAEISDRLEAMKLRVLRGDQDQKWLFGKAHRYVDVESPEKLLTYMRWLNRNGFHQKVVDLLKENWIYTRKDIALVYLDALAALDKWETIQAKIKKKQLPIDNLYRTIFTARFHYEKGNDEALKRNWEKAIMIADGHPEHPERQLQIVERYARILDADKLQEMVLKKMLYYPSVKKEVYQGLITIYRKRQDAEKLFELYVEMSQQYRDDPVISNDLAYLRLLRSTEIENAYQQAKKLVNKHPSYVTYHMTLALAWLKKDNAKKALNTLQELDGKLNWYELPDRYKVVAVAVTSAAGDQKTAKKLADTIGSHRLLEEEMELLNQAVTRAN